MAEARIYVADLAAYNDGKLVGEWLDLSDYNDGDEVMEAIDGLLKEWSKESGEEREEFAIHDYEGFPEQFYSEYMGRDDFDKIIKIIKAAEENDLPVEVLLEYASNTGADPEDLSDLPYNGKFDDEEDFAYRMVEDGVIADLSRYLEMYPTDMRILAQEEADARVDNMDDDDLLEAADMNDDVEAFEEKKSRIESIRDEIQDLEVEIDDLYYEEPQTESDAEKIDSQVEELREKIEMLKSEKDDLQDEIREYDFNDRDDAIEQAKEKLREEYYDEIYEELEKDAVGYFVDNFGYEESDLADGKGFHVDYKALARDLSYDYLFIEHDGDLYVFNNYARGGKLYEDGGVNPKIYEKVVITIRDVDMGGDVVYKGEHWFTPNVLDTKSTKEIGNFVMKKYGLDYGNTYKYSLKRTGETKERYDEGGELDPVASAKTKAIQSIEHDDMVEAAKEYAGKEWDSMSKAEKDELIAQMYRDRSKYIGGLSFKDGGMMENGGEVEEDALEAEKKKLEELTKNVEDLGENEDVDEISLPQSMAKVYEYKVQVGLLQSAIDSIKKLSKKFRIKEPKIEIGEERRVGIDYDDIWGEYSYYVNLVPVKIYVDEIFKIYDYNVIGVVDNNTGGVVSFGEETVPEGYREPNNICDLCKTNRRRGKTWIVKNTQKGEYSRFGSDCVQRVYGINPAKFLKAVDFFNNLSNILTEDLGQGEYGGGRQRGISPLMRYVPFDVAVTVCKEVYDTHGYIKKEYEYVESRWANTEKKRTNKGKATADIALNLMEDIDYLHSVVPNNKFINDFKVYWVGLDIKNTEGFNSFIKNIQDFVVASNFQLKDTGLLVYAIHHYITKKDEVKLESQYIGVVGEKIALQNLKIIFKKDIETAYGWSNLWKLVDESGNNFTKFGEISGQYFVKNEKGYNPLDDYESLKSYTLKEGDFVTFVAEIKSHQEYRGEKTTQLGRVSAYKPPKEKKEFGGMMAKGGKVTFKRKVKSISESLLERKKVPARLRKDYGKTYDKKEAVESAKRIAGAMRKKELAQKKK